MKTLSILFVLVFFSIPVAPEKMVLVKGIGFEPFYIDQYEVTMAEFEAFVKATGYKTSAEVKGIGPAAGYKAVPVSAGSDKTRQVYSATAPTPGVNWRHNHLGELISKELYDGLPVTRVSLKDAKAYAQWAGKELPTVEQWEIAASGGNLTGKYKYAGSNRPVQVGWFDANGRDKIMLVGQLMPNELGIYDMSGNAEEIALDNDDPNSFYRKGGDSMNGSENMEIKSNYSRKIQTEDFCMPYLGFRCVKKVK